MIPVYYVGMIGTHESGKTTASDRLEELLNQVEGLHVLRVNFADTLRAQLSFSLPYEPGAEKRHPLERQMLQAAGESWRWADKNYFTRPFLEAANHYELADKVEAENKRAIVVLNADAYNFNELFLFDSVFAAINPSKLGKLETGYVPETIAATEYILANPEFIAPMFGHWQSYYISSPVDFSNYGRVSEMANQVLGQFNYKLAKLGHLPLAFPVTLFQEQEDSHESRTTTTA